jgi:hypothetical protein
MKRSIVALGFAVFAVGSFAQDQHRNALKSEQYSVVKQQVADAEEWLRSRPSGNRDASRDSTNQHG